MTSLTRRGLGLLLGALFVGLPLRAEPTLHEFFEPDPVEDLKLGATTRGGSVPAAIETESGVVPAPVDKRERTASTPAYGGTSTPNSSDASYRIDRDTTRPSLVSYDDPFTPPITPFKRLFAYDAVDANYDLYVHAKALTRLEIGGSPRLGEDSFYADMFVDLAANLPVRIPSVGPGTRVLAAEIEPDVPFEILGDGVDNWYIKSSERRRARLIMQVAIERGVFGSPYGDSSWDALVHFVVALPRELREHARGVLDALGLSQTLTPREAVTRMVAHFRSFAPSEELPQARSGKQLYTELALSKKGVCRHRAYAFVVTALALGIPARLIRNEAHAWVEVYDTRRWHRIDLGGAAGELDSLEDTHVSPYRSPSDPFAWPEGSSSGLGLANNARSARQSGPEQPGSPQSPGEHPAGSASAQTEPHRADQAPPGPKAEVSLTADDPRVRRGHRLRLSGTVSAHGQSCGPSRIDVTLVGASGRRIPVGALPSDGSGHFQGAITVPLDIEVGDYQVRASSPGTERCGPSD